MKKKRVEAVLKTSNPAKNRDWYERLPASVAAELLEIREKYSRGETVILNDLPLAQVIAKHYPEVDVMPETIAKWIKKGRPSES